ncbi:MAG: hypothetical protein HY735_32810 [Verrucomicrobia bacterium]|nr:hypothetical protein [Verrucomicrobiota bacterium]
MAKAVHFKRRVEAFSLGEHTRLRGLWPAPSPTTSTRPNASLFCRWLTPAIRPAGYLFGVAQIFNLPYRRIASCWASKRLDALAWSSALPIANRRYSAVRRSRNQNGARPSRLQRPHTEGEARRFWDASVVWSRCGLEGRAPEKSSRLATIPGDTDRLEVCATTARRFRGRSPYAQPVEYPLTVLPGTN